MNASYVCLVQALTHILNIISPIVPLRENSTGGKLWLTPDTVGKCKVERQLYEDMLHARIDREYYKKLCKDLEYNIKNLKIKFNSYYLINFKNKMKTTWNFIELIKGTKKREDICINMIHTKHICRNDTDIMN